MKISVITVVYNDLAGLKKTAESVLSQTSADFEYIILDGESTDGTVEYMNSLQFRGKKKSQSDSGIYNAMNTAVKMAEGDYCLFMNAGDTFHDNKVLDKAAQILGKADIYVGNTIEIGEKKMEFPAPYPMTVGHLLKTSIYHQSTFTRRFGSWLKVLDIAGLEQTRTEMNISEEDLFDNLETIWRRLGRQPRYHEVCKPFSKYSNGTYCKRFGSFRKALEAFVASIRESTTDVEVHPAKPQKSKKNPRSVNYRTRFKVLQRDGFYSRH